MFTIQFRRPYTGDLITQSYRTREEMDRMIHFYESCNVRVTLV